MRYYSHDHDALVKDMSSVHNLGANDLEAMLKAKEIHWYDLQENATNEFGLNSNGGASSGVVNTINAATDVLLSTKKLSQDPLGGDPFKIINSTILQTVQAQLPKDIGNNGSGPRQFSALADEDWQPANGKVNEIGLLRVEPITFQAGVATLSSDGEAQVDKIAELLANNYPDDRVVIRGHTDKGDDEAFNVQLSQERANAVMQRLIQVHGIDPNRLKAEGMGSSQRPKHRDGESFREYMYRIPRVEFTLYEDVSNF
jgi:outer membrane protein OmpA-like peptidoglycan-associated protein